MRLVVVKRRQRDADVLAQQIDKTSRFRVKGERGVYTYRGTNDDGTIRVYGGVKGREMWREYPRERLRLLKR